MNRFVVVNEATTASALQAHIPLSWLTAMATALTIYVNRDVSYWWGGAGNVRAGSGGTDVAPDEWVFAWLDNLPQAPGAVAFHDVNGAGVPVLFGALTTCSTLDDVSSATSHEIAETWGDVGANVWADDGQGKEWARELCDAVQERTYRINGVAVSDFLTPNFFIVGAPGPYTHMASLGLAPDLPSPFATASGGYQIYRQSGGGESQVQGMIPPHRVAKAKHWSGRLAKRGVKIR